jgi:transposase
MDILNLPGLVVVHQTYNDPDRFCYLDVEATETQNDCPKCGVTGQLYRFGTRKQIYRDSPIRQYSVVISLKLQRFKCKQCGATFLQSVEGLDPKRLMTARCVQYIREQCLLDTFIHVAEHIGCDEKTIRNIANDYIGELNADRQPYLPEWLGIDETMLDGKLRCVLTDVVERRPIDLLSNREKLTVVGWLWPFRDSKSIRGVTIDMWRPFQKAVATVFPDLPVIADKFHVLRMANTAVDSVRVRHGKKRPTEQRRQWLRGKFLLRKRADSLSPMKQLTLDSWLSEEPDIATAYSLKEEFFRIYDFQKKYDAEKALDAWRYSVPKHLHPDFKELLSATKNWRREILAYFDHQDSNGNRLSNAYTETFNGESKVASRAGRGYTFEVLRARVLFGEKPFRFSDVFTPELSRALAAQTDQMLAQVLAPPHTGQCMSCLGAFPTNELQYRQTKSGAVVVVCKQCVARFGQGPLVFNPEPSIAVS